MARDAEQTTDVVANGDDEAVADGNVEDDSDNSVKSQDSEDESDQQSDDQRDQEREPISKPRKVHKLSLRKTEDFNAKLKQRGVVYVARIPPRMTPTKIKTMLSDFGEITRVYLAEEDAAARKRRRKLSGNGSKRYVEGWVEFASKKIAKRVAASLNATPMTNDKRSHHHGDLWMLKYLSKFQWSHLTEKVAYERRVREQKLRLETMQAKRETAAYKSLVETGKKIDKIAERKRRRAEREGKVAEDQNKKRKPAPQVRPFLDGGESAAKSALLGALV